MNDPESRDMEQDQQRQDHELLRSEREARGEVRDSHLEAGREQARNENALAREGAPSQPAPAEALTDDDYETKLTARKEAEEAAMKAMARSQYEGTDESFEQDWPEIREQLITETVEQDLKYIRRRL